LVGHALDGRGVRREHHPSTFRRPPTNVRGDARSVALDDRGDVRLSEPVVPASDASNATSIRPSRTRDQSALQQWDLRRRLPGRGHRVGQFALFVEEVGQSARHAIRFDHDHGGVVDFIEQRPLLIHEEGHPALHAVEELTRRESVERRAAPRHGVDHALGALTRVVAQEPFARRGDHCLVEVVQGTLIGDVEGGQSLDLVTEEVETNRLVSCAGQRSTMPPRTANSARCSTRLSRR